MKKKFMSFDTKLDLLSTQLTDVISENKSLKVMVEHLETKLSVIEQTQSTTPLNLTAQENVYTTEFLDRQSRSRNIILLNVPEVSASLPGLLDDNSFVKDVFNTISVSIIPVSVHRLGKISNKPRLLRVSLPASTDVFEIKRKLTAVDKFSTIRITSDLTLSQRKYLSSIVSQLKSRKDPGENNLFIKYINGLSTISKND